MDAFFLFCFLVDRRVMITSSILFYSFLTKAKTQNAWNSSLASLFVFMYNVLYDVLNRGRELSSYIIII